MILLLSCRANGFKWERIRRGWLNATGIPYVIVVADPSLPRGGHRFDPDTRLLEVGCEDGYDELSHKVAYGIRAIESIWKPSYLLKVDDDLVVRPDALRRYVESPMHGEYEGHLAKGGYVSTWGIERYQKPENKLPSQLPPILYCGGPVYYLGRRSVEVLSSKMDPDRMKFEDVNVGMTLHERGIYASFSTLYSDVRGLFEQGHTICWHDAEHLSEQNLPPTKI